MNLQIRDPRARELAMRLAEHRGVSMTEAVVSALEADLARLSVNSSTNEALQEIRAALKALALPGGHTPSENEVDQMWGHL